MDKDDILDALSVTLPVCAELYCGINKNDFNEDVLVESIAFIYRNYNTIGVTEIKQAFELSATNKLNVNMTAYSGKFNISMLGDILSAYVLERNKVLNKLLDAHGKLSRGENIASEVEQKNILARQQIVQDYMTELQNVKSGRPRRYETVYDIRSYWAKVLIEMEIIKLPEDTKKRLWQEAIDLVKKDINKTASDFTNIYEAKSARQFLNSIENNGVQTLKEKAEVMYGKLIIWESLK